MNTDLMDDAVFYLKYNDSENFITDVVSGSESNVKNVI